MTRDERMAALLDCVDFYATHPKGDYGRRAQAVLAKVATDERDSGMLKKVEEEFEGRARMTHDEAINGPAELRAVNIMLAAQDADPDAPKKCPECKSNNFLRGVVLPGGKVKNKCKDCGRIWTSLA